MDDPPVIERLPLEHPLPQEIQSMASDDTVCKFCGVSYLIHREVKKLEDKVKEIEKELEHYKGSVEREIVLKEQVKQLKEKDEENQKSLQHKDASIVQMRRELLEKDDLIQSLTQSRNSLQDKLTESESQVDNLRKQNSACKQSLPSIQASVRQQRSELHNIVNFVHQMKKSVHDTSDILNNTVQRVCASHIKETYTLKERIETLKEENRQSQQKQQSLQQAVQSAQRQSSQVEGMEAQLREKQEQCNKLRNNIDKLQSEVDSALARSRSSISEAAQYKELLRSKSQEIDDIQVQHRKREQVTEQLNTKLQQELKKKSMDLQSALNDCRKLQEQATDTARIEEEIQRKAAMNMTEAQHIRDALLKAQEECNAIKEERELMITSHQNRIEQLRDSFKQKLLEAERWPEKMDDTLQKERSRHSQEQQELEEKMSNAFKMELEIEKQKHQELVDKYKVDHQQAIDKLKSELKSIGSHHRAEMNQLDRQLQERRNQSSAEELNLKREVHSLKSIINNLEDRLGRAGLEDNQAAASLKAELREAEEDLLNAREQSKQLEEKLNQSKEEIMFLQETVRHECEERFELTEALSEAKEQLLANQRHSTFHGGSRPGSGNRRTSQDGPSGLTNISGLNGTNKGGIPGGISGLNSLKQPQSPVGGLNSLKQPQSPIGGLNSIKQVQSPVGPIGGLGSIKQAQSPTGQKAVASNSISIGFESSSAQLEGGMMPHRKVKHGSVNDSRQRIANAIGRK